MFCLTAPSPCRAVSKLSPCGTCAGRAHKYSQEAVFSITGPSPDRFRTSVLQRVPLNNTAFCPHTFSRLLSEASAHFPAVLLMCVKHRNTASEYRNLIRLSYYHRIMTDKWTQRQTKGSDDPVSAAKKLAIAVPGLYNVANFNTNRVTALSVTDHGMRLL